MASPERGSPTCAAERGDTLLPLLDRREDGGQMPPISRATSRIPVIVSKVATTGMDRLPGKVAKPSVETDEILTKGLLEGR